MAGSEDHSPNEDYFNDILQQLPGDRNDSGDLRAEGEDNSKVPKPKRIACVLCRRRKLKCDGIKPSCATCTRLQHDCSYDEVRRKSGPKRGYVKALEARLAQVETLLKTQDAPVPGRKDLNGGAQSGGQNGIVLPDFENIAIGRDNYDMLPDVERIVSGLEGPTQAQYPHSMLGSNANGMSAEEPFPREMIGLGLDEPLPNQDVVNELNQAYFDKIHPSFPMMHRPRYYAAMNLAPHMRPPVCLRYTMWANAAAVTDKFESLQDHFYQRARRYIQQDEMKGHGESMITIAHCQTWALLAGYEFKLMYFPRAWMSAGRACRMAQMMGLHRLDGKGLDVKQCLPPPKDWTEREERRRTFWMSFCIDRYSSIGTGWPMTIEEGDIMTNLPAEEDQFNFSRPGKTLTLEEVFEPNGVPNLSSFGGVILMSALFGRNLTHLHRPGPDDREDDLNGEFWKRHRHLDNILLNTALSLPDRLRLPSGLNDPNIVFTNMSVHTSTICLHQAAIFRADQNRMPSRITAESKVRCITAAAEIASIMRQISHLDLSSMNPFISFCLYVAARVFVQYLKSRPNDAQVRASLQFLLSAMYAIKRKNPLTESFLVQLDVDLESAGVEEFRSLRVPISNASVANRSPECPTVHLGMRTTSADRVPTYGDEGLGKYNNPAATVASDVQPCTSFAYALGSAEAFSADMPGCIDGEMVLELPNRQSTPGSTPGSASYRSPQSNNNVEMDTTPDGSHDQQTPNSLAQNASSQTSNTGYSPHVQQQQQGQAVPNLRTGATFGILTNSDPNAETTNFNADFDMHSATGGAQQSSGFVLPQDWGSTGLTPGSSGTGMTPGPTGLTPGSASGMTPGMMSDMVAMSEAEWTQMLDGLNTGIWDAGLSHYASMQDSMAGRR